MWQKWPSGFPFNFIVNVQSNKTPELIPFRSNFIRFSLQVEHSEPKFSIRVTMTAYPIIYFAMAVWNATHAFEMHSIFCSIYSRTIKPSTSETDYNSVMSSIPTMLKRSDSYSSCSLTWSVTTFDKEGKFHNTPVWMRRFQFYDLLVNLQFVRIGKLLSRYGILRSG